MVHKPSIVAKVYLWICVLTFLGLGVVFLSNPTLLSKVDIELNTPTALADVRADYGGCIFGLGCFLGWCAIRESRIRTGLLCTGLVFTGYALGRLVSLMIDGQPKNVIFYLLAIEAAGALLAFGAMMLRVKDLDLKSD